MLLGGFAGSAVVSTLVFPPAVVMAFILVFISKPKFRLIPNLMPYCLIFGVLCIMTVLKHVSVFNSLDNLSNRLYYLVLIFLSPLITLQRNFCIGFSSIILILAIFEGVVVTAQVLLGVELGAGVVVRSDGVRATGIVGNNFLSAAILLAGLGFSLCFRRRLLVAVFTVFSILNGSLRSLIYCVWFFYSSRWARSSQQFTAIVALLALPIAVVALTWATVYLGVVSNNSGNSLRLMAWAHALDAIRGSSLIFGAASDVSALPAGMTVNTSTVSEFLIFESKLLEDIYSFGLLYTLGKILLIFSASLALTSRPIAPGVWRTPSLSSLMLADYALLFLFGTPVLGFSVLVMFGMRDRGY